MNRDDIIKLARKADNINCDCCLPDPDEEFMEDFLVAFAALVAQHEREACAKVADEMERPNLYGVRECAAAIRARGQQ